MAADREVEDEDAGVKEEKVEECNQDDDEEEE